jgi:hypothetical protein
MINLGKSATHVVDGKIYKTSRLTVGIIAKLKDWVSEQIGDPFATAKIFVGSGVDKETIDRLIKEGQQVKQDLESFNLNGPLAMKYLGTELGATKVFQLLLEEAHPGITMDEALKVVMELTPEQRDKTISDATGDLPKNGEAGGSV